MPIAREIWIETIRPRESASIIAAFVLSDQPDGDPARMAKPFVMPVEGFGDVRFSFVACLKGQAIYSASLEGLEQDQGPSPARAELLCRELLMGVL